MTAPTPESATGHLDEPLAVIPSRHPAAGLAVGVVRDGRLRFTGTDSPTSPRAPVTQDTAFRTAGCTWMYAHQLTSSALVDAFIFLALAMVADPDWQPGGAVPGAARRPRRPDRSSRRSAAGLGGRGR
jgi:hypothetical protein